MSVMYNGPFAKNGLGMMPNSVIKVSCRACMPDKGLHTIPGVSYACFSVAVAKGGVPCRNDMHAHFVLLLLTDAFLFTFSSFVNSTLLLFLPL